MERKSKLLIEATKELSVKCNKLIPMLIENITNLKFVYNPLDYAWEPHKEYIKKYGGLGAQTIIMGMNPGHGMGNTGIPFGCPKKVRNYLKIKDCKVRKPEKMHPKRKIQGLNCKKPEISGKRIWKLIEEIYGPPDNAFKNIFIINHFPLWMFNDSGQNITPEKLNRKKVKKIFDICDQYVIDVAKILKIKTIVGVGKYAERMAENVTEKKEMKHIKKKMIPHPSPANPLANKEKGAIWRKIAANTLKKKI